MSELGKEQLKALGKSGGRWKSWRLGQAWNAWRQKTEDCMEQRRTGRKVLSFMRAGGVRQLFQRWRFVYRNGSEQELNPASEFVDKSAPLEQLLHKPVTPVTSARSNPQRVAAANLSAVDTQADQPDSKLHRLMRLLFDRYDLDGSNTINRSVHSADALAVTCCLMQL